MRALSNIEINNYYSFRFRKNEEEDSFGGCYSKDVLPKLESKAYIINLADEEDDGTHWTMVYNCNKSFCFYFDSFGCPPPLDVLNRMRETKKTMIYSNVYLQRINSSSCGYFCIYVIDYLNLCKSSFKECILHLLYKIFKPFKELHNEKVLRRYFNSSSVSLQPYTKSSS